MITGSAGNPIVVTGSPTMVTFTLTNSGVPASSITWSVDNPGVGTIDSNGVLHLGGTVGGVIVVTATAGGRSISITVTVNVESCRPARSRQATRPRFEPAAPATRRSDGSILTTRPCSHAA